MDESTKAKFKKYEELKIAERGIKEELEELKGELLPAIPEDTKIEGAHGMFTRKSTSKWEYSPQVKQAEEELKERKKEEERTGIALRHEGTVFIEYRLKD